MARARDKSARRSVREESRAVYRAAIVEAAMRVFGQTGFHEAKIADIAAEAGVATGTLYNYFSSKEEIFESILEDGRTALAAEIMRLGQIEDPLLRVREVIRGMFGFLEQHGALFTLHMQLGANPMDFKGRNSSSDEAFRQQFLGLVESAVREAADRLRSDVSTEVLAWTLGGVMHGAILRWVDSGCSAPLCEHADLIMDLFLQGATPR